MNDALDSSSLIDPAFDKYLDGHPTRRELQKAFNKMGNNDSELMLMVDNLNLVVNFLCEKAGCTKAEIDAWVASKAEELNKMKTTQQALTEGTLPRV
jgi:hypothetical protein